MSLPVACRTMVIGWLVIGASQFIWAQPDKVPWLTDVPTAQRVAAERNLPILLHFTSDSCPPCRRLEKNVFSQAEFGYAIGQAFIPVKVNVSHQPQIAQRYNVTSWPTDIVVSPTGQVIHQMISPQDGSQYLQTLRQVAWHFQQQTNLSSVASSPAGGTFQSPLTAARNRPTPYTAGQAGLVSTATGDDGRQNPANDGYPATVNQSAFPGPSTPPSVESNPYSNRPYAPVTTSTPVATSSVAASVPGPAGYGPMPIQNPYFQPDRSPEPVQSVAAGATPSVAVAPVQPPLPTHVPADTLVQTAYQSAPSTAPLTPAANSAATTNLVARNSIAMDGYCPVTVMDENRWALGNARWGAQHRGKIYLFLNEAAQQRFLADPERYAPVLAGFDPVAMADFGRFSTGKREHGVRYNERMYLFEDEDSLQRFSQSPDQYVARVQATLQAIATGH